jgi:hypothetical protein
LSRSTSGSFSVRHDGSTNSKTQTWTNPLPDQTLKLNARSIGISGETFGNARIAISTIGTALDLGALDSILATLMTTVSALT